MDLSSLDTATRTKRNRRLQTTLSRAWANDVVVVCAAGNNGINTIRTPQRSLDIITPQLFGTDTNPLITVGGTINNGSLWYETTPVNPPAGFVGPNIAGFGQLTGGSITVYAQALEVATSASSATGDLQTGTSFASPQVVNEIESPTLVCKIC
jgi:hypothetical protein